MHIFSKRLSILAAAAASAVLLDAGAAHAQQIAVNFSGQNADNVGAQTAGVIPQANWNDAAGNTGTMGSLVNSAGAMTSVSINWNAGGTWSTDNEDNTSQFVNAGDESLMKGYLDTNEGTTGSITVTGLAPGNYNVFVYSLTAVNGRDSGNVVVEGTQKKSTSIISTAFVQGGGPGGATDVGGLPGNYNLYSNVNLSDGQLDLAITGQTFRTAINGIQIVPVPEPASLGLLGLSAIGLLTRRRRA